MPKQRRLLGLNSFPDFFPANSRSRYALCNRRLRLEWGRVSLRSRSTPLLKYSPLHVCGQKFPPAAAPWGFYSQRPRQFDSTGHLIIDRSCQSPAWKNCSLFERFADAVESTGKFRGCRTSVDLIRLTLTGTLSESSTIAANHAAQVSAVKLI